jgi:CTP synthase (UTP-ammonia lyase)
MVVEHVRNVLGFRDADHQETAPDAARLAITALSCSLVGQEHEILLEPNSLMRDWYERDRAVEDYYCNYGVNPEFVPLLEGSGLGIGATDAEGDVRSIERRDHPFFVGTLFLPQTRSTERSMHPILRAFADAVQRHDLLQMSGSDYRSAAHMEGG